LFFVLRQIKRKKIQQIEGNKKTREFSFKQKGSVKGRHVKHLKEEKSLKFSEQKNRGRGNERTDVRILSHFLFVSK